MQLRKYRWSRDYESAEEELVHKLAAKKVKAERWITEEYEETAAHAHTYDTQFWCVEGSIVFNVDAKDITLQAGDTLDIPSGMPFSSKAGFSGCVCYESTEDTSEK